MVTKSILAAAVAVPMAAAAPASVKKATSFVPADFTTNIIGGSPASEGEFPFIVSLQRSGSHLCGGSLLNANTVVTAAHCDVGGTYSIRAGSLSSTSGGTTVSVSEVLNHPDYSSSGYDNDVALWHLSEPIEEGDGIEYVTLPSTGSDPAEGETSTVSGWGAQREGGGASASLYKVDVPIVDRDTCNDAYGGDITDGMVCAGLEAGGKDACQGDSGGPLTIDGTLVGVVSWGNGCARPGYYGVYSNVGKFADWIESNAW